MRFEGIENKDTLPFYIEFIYDEYLTRIYENEFECFKILIFGFRSDFIDTNRIWKVRVLHCDLTHFTSHTFSFTQSYNPIINPDHRTLN